MVFESLLVNSRNGTELKRRWSASDITGEKVGSHQSVITCNTVLLEQPPPGKALMKVSLLVLCSLHKPTPTHLTHAKALFKSTPY